MIEYRVMYNCYDGLGDIERNVYHSLVRAIEIRKAVEEQLLDGKGVAWIEVREVSAWKKVKLIK